MSSELRVTGDGRNHSWDRLPSWRRIWTEENTIHLESPEGQVDQKGEHIGPLC